MKSRRIEENNAYILNFAAVCLLCAAAAMLFLPFSGYVPTQRSTAQTGAEWSAAVVIDAGHGGEDGGTVGNGLVEKDLNLDVAKRLCALLEREGAHVVMTRESDTMLYDKSSDYKGKKKALDLRARLEIAEGCENPVFVSIHMNYFPQTRYSGLQVYYSANNPLSRTLAEGIQSACRASLQPENTRAVKEATSAIFLLDKLSCPAVLVECGFLSNPDEAARLSDENYRERLAEVIFCALRDYILSRGT